LASQNNRKEGQEKKEIVDGELPEAFLTQYDENNCVQEFVNDRVNLNSLSRLSIDASQGRAYYTHAFTVPISTPSLSHRLSRASSIYPNVYLRAYVYFYIIHSPTPCVYDAPTTVSPLRSAKLISKKFHAVAREVGAERWR